MLKDFYLNLISPTALNESHSKMFFEFLFLSGLNKFHVNRRLHIPRWHPEQNYIGKFLKNTSFKVLSFKLNNLTKVESRSFKDFATYE
jgi:hypothetical protein